MKQFENVLKEKISKKDGTYGLLLSIVKSRKINDADRLRDYLSNQELVCREKLAKFRTAPTMQTHRRECVRKLEEIKAMRKLLEKL